MESFEYLWLYFECGEFDLIEEKPMNDAAVVAGWPAPCSRLPTIRMRRRLKLRMMMIMSSSGFPTARSKWDGE